MSSSTSAVKAFRTARSSIKSGVQLPPDIISAMAAFGDAYDDSAATLMAGVLEADFNEFLGEWGIEKDVLVADFLTNRVGGPGRKADNFLARVDGAQTTLLGGFLRGIRELRGPLTGVKLSKLLGSASVKARVIIPDYVRGIATFPLTAANLAAFNGRELATGAFMQVARGPTGSSYAPKQAPASVSAASIATASQPPQSADPVSAAAVKAKPVNPKESGDEKSIRLLTDFLDNTLSELQGSPIGTKSRHWTRVRDTVADWIKDNPGEDVEGVLSKLALTAKEKGLEFFAPDKGNNLVPLEYTPTALRNATSYDKWFDLVHPPDVAPAASATSGSVTPVSPAPPPRQENAPSAAKVPPKMMSSPAAKATMTRSEAAFRAYKIGVGKLIYYAIQDMYDQRFLSDLPKGIELYNDATLMKYYPAELAAMTDDLYIQVADSIIVGSTAVSQEAILNRLATDLKIPAKSGRPRRSGKSPGKILEKNEAFKEILADIKTRDGIVVNDLMHRYEQEHAALTANDPAGSAEQQQPPAANGGGGGGSGPAKTKPEDSADADATKPKDDAERAQLVLGAMGRMPVGGGDETLIQSADRLPGKFRELLMVDGAKDKDHSGTGDGGALERAIMQNWGMDTDMGLYGSKLPKDHLRWSAQMDGILSAIRPVAYGERTHVPGHLDPVTMPASWAKSRDILLDRTSRSKAKEITPKAGTHISTFAGDLVRQSATQYKIPGYDFAGHSTTMSEARRRVMEQARKPLRGPGMLMEPSDKVSDREMPALAALYNARR